MKRLVQSAAFYPITLLYLMGVLTGVGVIQGLFEWYIGLLMFGVAAALAVLVASLREVRAVHVLVNGQRHELISRIDELSGLLVSSGIGVPPEGEKEADAREDASQEERV